MTLTESIVFTALVLAGIIWAAISGRKRANNLPGTFVYRRRRVLEEMDDMKKWAQSQDRSELEKIINRKK